MRWRVLSVLLVSFFAAATTSEANDDVDKKTRAADFLKLAPGAAGRQAPPNRTDHEKTLAKQFLVLAQREMNQYQIEVQAVGLAGVERSEPPVKCAGGSASLGPQPPNP